MSTLALIAIYVYFQSVFVDTRVRNTYKFNILTRMMFIKHYAPQQMLVHKGGQINNVQLITGGGGGGGGGVRVYVNGEVKLL